jgi:hypothetical protein
VYKLEVNGQVIDDDEEGCRCTVGAYKAEDEGSTLEKLCREDTSLAVCE